jgi:hypothetical protein
MAHPLLAVTVVIIATVKGPVPIRDGAAIASRPARPIAGIEATRSKSDCINSPVTISIDDCSIVIGKVIPNDVAEKASSAWERFLKWLAGLGVLGGGTALAKNRKKSGGGTS